MRRTLPKDTDRLLWTNHVTRKMAYYRLSESRILRVLRNPARSEEGIAPGTVAVMQPAITSKKPQEIWVMYQQVGKKRRVITAWRYPGKSRVRAPIPIPQEIMDELELESGDRVTG